MSVCSKLRRRSLSGADGPHRLVRHRQRVRLRARDLAKSNTALPAQNALRQSAFALGQHLADADDRLEPSSQRSPQLAVNRLIGFAEILAAFGMADDHVC